MSAEPVVPVRPVYHVRRAPAPPSGGQGWDASAWAGAEIVELAHFHDRGTHRPRARARLMYDDRCLYVLFHVADRYVRSVARQYQDMVCQDSCVEFFVQPKGEGGGYLNFEVSAGGILLLQRFPRPPPEVGNLGEGRPVPHNLVRNMVIHHSLPDRVEPEIAEPCEWTIEYAIPLDLFEQYEGALRPLAGQTWRANFYKCAEHCSQPHWAMWSPVRTGFSFHQPRYFGDIVFVP